ncbi:MAG: circadian clock KaiB family protein [Gammaproteobacteria bacterium]
MDSKNASVTRRYEKWFERYESQRYVLRLFVAGMTLRSTEAVARIKSLCDEHLKGRYELDIIDIYQRPELAKEYQVIAVPTLVKTSPAPARCLVGDFSDVDKVLRSLDMHIRR